MHKMILCTTGTSIANGCKNLKRSQEQPSQWDEELPGLTRELREKIASIDYLNDPAARRGLSAELNTLDRIDLQEGDRVALIATDNAPGRLCSRFLAEIIEEIYGCDVEIKRIEGMQIYNARRLREKGLKHLVQTLLDDYLANDQIRYQYEIIVNPTGGYKAVVPFLTVLGMLYGRKAIYLFEHAEELIELPPLPLTFDLHLFERVREALRYIEDEVAVPPAEYFARIVDYDPAERDLFLSFTEPFEENKITLSPLTYVLLKIEASAQPSFISRKALAKLDTLQGEKRKILERLIAHTSNPLWREHKTHRWPNNPGILIIKAGNTAERLAGFVTRGRFHVALLFDDHDDYERELERYTINDLKSWEYQQWESTVSPEETSHFSATPDRQKFIREIEQLTATVEQLRHTMATHRTEQKASKNLVARLRSEVDQWRTAADTAHTEHNKLQLHCASWKRQLADQSKILEQLQHDHAQVTAQAQASAERIEALERARETLQVDLDSERMRAQTLRQERVALGQALTAAIQRRKKSQKRICLLRQALRSKQHGTQEQEQLEAQLAKAIQKRKKATHKITKQRARLDALVQTLEQSRRTILKLRRQKEKLYQRSLELKQYQKRLAKLKKKYRKSTRKNRKLTARIKTLEARIKRQDKQKNPPS